MSIPLIFITSFTIAFSGALMPGPVLTATIHQVAKRGAWAGVLIAAGHAILEFALVVALYFGLGRLLENESLFRNVLGSVGLVGGLLLIAMALGMARYRPKPIEAEQSAAANGTWLEPVAAGIVTSLSNPYWLGWWVTVGLPLIAKSRAHALLGLAVFYAGHVLADFTWYGAVGFALAKGRAFAGGAAFKWLIRFCAVFMAAMGVYFIVSGIGFLKPPQPA